MKHKQRLDVLMVEKGLAESRSKAQAMIMSGIVFVDGQKIDKPGTELGPDAALDVHGPSSDLTQRWMCMVPSVPM